MSKSYDQKCYALAECFVDDSDILGSLPSTDRSIATGRVARVIQVAIEEEIGELEEEAKAKREDRLMAREVYRTYGPEAHRREYGAES